MLTKWFASLLNEIKSLFKEEDEIWALVGDTGVVVETIAEYVDYEGKLRIDRTGQIVNALSTVRRDIGERVTITHVYPNQGCVACDPPRSN